MFWENDKPVNEVRVQLILENIIEAYFYKEKVDISRECIVSNGKVDFKFYRNIVDEERILVEIKLAKSASLKKGYERQLTDYMYSSKCDNAFYLVICYTDEDIEKLNKFIGENVYTDQIQYYINIRALDLRKRETPSRL